MRTVLEAAATILMMGAVPIIIRHVPANPWTIGLIRLGVATAGMALIVALTRRWVSPAVAAELVNETDLGEVIAAFAASVS